jgi:hypothetical protein
MQEQAAVREKLRRAVSESANTVAQIRLQAGMSSMLTLLFRCQVSR